MTHEGTSEPREEKEASQGWMRDIQRALDRTGDSVRTAWDATREDRMRALEAAKQATKELGEVLEKGVEAARQRWETERADEGQQPAETPVRPETTPTTPATPPATDTEGGTEGRDEVG